MNNATALTVFNFQGHELHVVEHHGEPWFIGKEVCDALGIVNSWDAIARLSSHQRDDLGITDAIGRTQQMNIISEGGVYKLAFRSRKKEAEEFTDLVVDVILPSIRKTGRYTRVLTDEEALPIEVLARQLAHLQDRVERLEAEAEHHHQPLLCPQVPMAYNRLPLTHEQEKAQVLRVVCHHWEVYGTGITANRLAWCFVKRLSPTRARRLLRELATEGAIEHYNTPHSAPHGGKFRPASFYLAS